jgi:formiminotetrahydrofolate cyclodeaminase
MLDTRPRTEALASLLGRPLGEIVDAIADGDISSRDGSLAAVACATSAGCLVAACTDLADLPESQPRLMDLARVLARARYLRQQLSTLVDDVALAELRLTEARALPGRSTNEHMSRRSATQLALKRALDRRLSVAAIAAELAGMAHEVELLAAGKHAALTRLSDTLAGSALAWMLELVEHELESAAEPWPREYVSSELERLHRTARSLNGSRQPS